MSIHLHVYIRSKTITNFYQIMTVEMMQHAVELLSDNKDRFSIQ